MVVEINKKKYKLQIKTAPDAYKPGGCVVKILYSMTSFRLRLQVSRLAIGQ